MICETHHLGPVTLRAGAGGAGGAPGSPVQLVSSEGGSSCVVSWSAPQTDLGTGTPSYHGLVVALEGRQGSRWTPVRRAWAPAYALGSRQLVQYQGGAFEQFRALLWIEKSGITPTTWATVIRDLHVDLTVGEAGAGGVAPGASFLVTGRTSSMPSGSDAPQVSASPERRRLIVELVDLLGAIGAGVAWSPVDLSPPLWVPLSVGVPRVFEVSAPLYVGADPAGSAIDVLVIEELS